MKQNKHKIKLRIYAQIRVRAYYFLEENIKEKKIKEITTNVFVFHFLG